MKIDGPIAYRAPDLAPPAPGGSARSFEGLVNNGATASRKKNAKPAQSAKPKITPDAALAKLRLNRLQHTSRDLGAEHGLTESDSDQESRTFRFDERGLLNGSAVDEPPTNSAASAETTPVVVTPGVEQEASPVVETAQAPVAHVASSPEPSIPEAAQANTPQQGAAQVVASSPAGAARQLWSINEPIGGDLKVTVGGMTRAAAAKAKVQLDPQFNLAVAVAGGEVKIVARARGLSADQAETMAEALSDALREVGLTLSELTINGAPIEAPSSNKGA